MNLKRVKATSEIKLDGITVEAEWRDKTLSAILLTDAKGNILRLAVENYTVGVFVAAPPEKKTVHVVSGKVRVLGTDVREEFDEPYEANSRKSELEQSDVCDSVTVTREEIDIPF